MAHARKDQTSIQGKLIYFLLRVNNVVFRDITIHQMPVEMAFRKTVFEMHLSFFL